MDTEIMMKLSEMKDMYVGRPAAVLGGGPSLPADMEKLPHGCLLIAVNYHALLICQPDYMVYNDFPESSPELAEAVRQARTMHVSPGPTSDIVFDVEAWIGFYSSNTATWLACWMGCDPVILCGMDCYQGDIKYFHEYEDGPHLHQESDHYIRPWVEEARARLPHMERVRAMSGPLVNVFGSY